MSKSNVRWRLSELAHREAWKTEAPLPSLNAKLVDAQLAIAKNEVHVGPPFHGCLSFRELNVGDDVGLRRAAAQEFTVQYLRDEPVCIGAGPKEKVQPNTLAESGRAPPPAPTEPSLVGRRIKSEENG